MMSFKSKIGLVLGILFISGNNIVSSQLRENPISCYTCEGDQCTTQLENVRVCSDVQQSCVTVFNENKTSAIARGCSDLIAQSYSSYCDKDSDKCISCESSECNDTKSLKGYVTCVACDSSTDKNCVLNPTAITTTKQCPGSCMVTLRARNSTDAHTSYELSRSCLEDKDVHDREMCLNGKDSMCRACQGDKCNIDYFPDNGLKCYKCYDDCEEPTIEYCVDYKEDDQCYFKFDDQKDIIKMGCRSELDDEELVALVKSKSLLLCSGSECNFFDKLPSDSHCKKCSSETDENCVTDRLKGVGSVACNGPFSQCYSMVQDGRTIRGCLAELPDDIFYRCLSNNTKDCMQCVGDDCNRQVHPEDRLRCHRCNSLEDPNCQDKPDSSTVCTVYSENEMCSSKLVNGVTYRGCSSDFTCDDSDKQYCKMCNSSDCNVVNLYQNNIGYPGNWQDLPINCYTCIDNECDSSNTTLLRKCENNNLQNCVTVFNDAGKVVQRGCSDTINDGHYDHHCDQNSDLCTYCKSSGCNDANSLEEFVDCLFCDSTTHPNCTSNAENVSKSRKCKNKCMTSLYPRSDEPDSALELSRSCLDDRDLDDRINCENNNDPYCKVCEGANCNKNKLPEKRLSCWRCSDDDCEDPVETVCPAYRENDLCFILFDSNGITQMGCKSDFENSTLHLLRKKMLFCNGDNCNGFEIVPNPHKCVVCNSAEDPLCATNPDSLTNATSCNNLPFTDCYSKITDDGHTVRGCIADLEMETIEKCIGNSSDIKCSACDSETCNNKLYPEDRLLCHRCSSNDNENCHMNPIESSACPIYQENDQCVVSLSNDETSRGCKSDLGCNENDRETCRLCSSNNCNTVDLFTNYIGKPGQWQDLPLNCYTCDGASECQASIDGLRMCENNNLQKCETVFDNTTKLVVRRGCSDDVAKTHGDFCDNNKGLCQQCKSSGCNNVESLNDYIDCVFCDSTSNRNCVLDPTNETLNTRKCKSQCMVALYPRSSEKDPSYELSRSCLDDKDMDDQKQCGDEYCHACNEGICNNNAFPINRHECFSCQSEDECEDPQIQKCLSYHPNDQCYFLFDDQGSINAMGCRSEYEHESVANLVKAKKMLLCNGEKCNTFETVPNPQSCIVCHSANDPQCATNPNLIINATTCSNLPYTGCYTLINEDGDTIRGCQSTLENELFYGCYNQSNSACSTCSSNNCNAEVFPKNRTMCHRCNSLDDGEHCASSSPSSNSVCPKYTDNESCVSTYKNGITYRGCSSELSCDTSDNTTCRICSGSGCNTVDLEYVAKDGLPGKWQDLPISCHTCKDDTCKQKDVPVEVCQNNNQQNCMTVFDNQGNVIQRGCSDSVNNVQERYCEQNQDKCYRCNSNACNKATKLTDYIQCISCDTNTNTSCITDPTSEKNMRLCYKGCMTALYPKSSEDDPAYGTVRTCLDDKEPSDQQTCNTDGFCKSCEIGSCNTHQIPEDRKKCYRCSGDGCQMPKSEFCPSYRKNDECTLLLDDQNSIIEAGCKSDYTIAQTVALIKTKKLHLCQGDNCNTFDSIPKTQKCSLCNSRTDPNCAIAPSNVDSNVTCTQQPYTQCYTRVLSDGATERGCLSNLPNEEFYDCLIGNSTTCKTCVGGACNKEIYPEGRKSCQVCDSDSDPNCHAKPDSLSICSKYQINDTCVTTFIAGATYRGCSSSIQCDSSDRKKCRICDADGCNTVNLERKQDDNFGKWQDLPLACYECKGETCKAPLGNTTKCENNNEQDCSIVYNSEGEVIRRGCSDDVEEEQEEYCDKNPKLCINCKSNGCNGDISPSSFTECVYCDSSKNKSCVTNPELVLTTRLCASECMTALYPSDSSANSSYELIRTCLNDKEKEDQSNCFEPHCKICSNNNCNTHDVPEDRLKCHACVGETCESPLSELCPLYKKDDKCFVQYDSSNSITEMGCLSQFRSQDISSILKTKKVYICEGENCNALPNLPQAQICVTCDSNNDVNCAIDAHQVGSVQTCTSLPYPNCHTSIASDGTTQRGCLADLPAEDFANCLISGGDKCTHCVGSVCNKENFPKTRLECYSCNSEHDKDCEDIPVKLSRCPYVRESEKCVTAFGGNRTDRGCSSQVLCDTNDKSTCRHCSSNGCNTLNLAARIDDDNYGMWQDLPLKCHNCTGSDCSKSLGPQIVCADGDRQDCMTVFDDTGVVIRRGCTYSVEDDTDLYCRKNPDKCFSCKSNACNDAWSLADFKSCVYCNSSIDSTCVTQPNNGNFRTRKCQNGCMAAIFTASNNSVQVVRTCLDDKEVLDRNQCTPETGLSCSSCTQDNCNSFNYPRNRLSCHFCDKNCDNTATEYCAAYETDDMCYSKYENGSVVLSGCSSDHDRKTLEEWKEKNQLLQCKDSVCNSPENRPVAQSCIACNSNSNVACATNPSNISTTELCNPLLPQCMMRVVDKETQRGCLNALSYNEQQECSAGSNLCTTCTGEKCNNKIYPDGRRSCHICRSDQHDNCVREPNSLSVCRYYSESNQCLTKFDGNITERGCTTELSCDKADEKHCQICDSDGCNTHQLNGALTIFANNLLLAILVSIVGLRAVKSC